MNDIYLLANRDNAAIISKFQHKLIKETLVDILTAIKLIFNLDLNQKRSVLE